MEGTSGRFRVLSIDGGGIRGLIPALVLSVLETRTGRRTAEMFDLVAGTSTGGIIALAVTKRDPQGELEWRADDLVDLYETEGPRIFEASLFHRLRSGFSIGDEKYPAAELERALERYLGGARLKDAATDVLVTAYETEQRFPFMFKSRKAVEHPEWDFPLTAVARATSAAPTYFEPPRLETTGPADYYSLLDGGVYANNPAMCALVEALRGRRALSDVLMVSLGTGEVTESLPHARIKDWGVKEWIWPGAPLLKVVMDGVSDTIDYQVEQLLDPDDYFRFQPKLDQADEDLDDASADNLRALKLQATRLLEERDERLKLERLVPRLMD